jgi:hypothetical protein
MIWVGHVTCVRERRGAYRFLVGKPEGKRPLGRPSCRWENNIKMNLQKVGWGWTQTGLNWLRIGRGGGNLKTQ